MSEKQAVLADGPISWEQSVELMESAVIDAEFDLGHSTMLKLSHETHGRCVLIHSASGMSGIIRL